MAPAAEDILVKSETAKKYISSYIQVDDFDEGEFFHKTEGLSIAELERLLNQIGAQLQTDLTGIVNRDFEKFISVFREVTRLGDDDVVQLEERVEELSLAAKSLHANIKESLRLQEELHQKIRENQHKQVNSEHCSIDLWIG